MRLFVVNTCKGPGGQPSVLNPIAAVRRALAGFSGLLLLAGCSAMATAPEVEQSSSTSTLSPSPDASTEGYSTEPDPPSSEPAAPDPVADTTSNEMDVSSWIAGARELLDEYTANDAGILFIGVQTCEIVPLSIEDAMDMEASSPEGPEHVTAVEIRALALLAEQTLCPGGVLLDEPDSLADEDIFGDSDLGSADQEPAAKKAKSPARKPAPAPTTTADPAPAPDPAPTLDDVEPEDDWELPSEPPPPPACPSWSELAGRVEVTSTRPDKYDIGKLTRVEVTLTNPRPYDLFFTGSLEYPAEFTPELMLQEDYSQAFERVRLKPGRQTLRATVLDMGKGVTSRSIRWQSWEVAGSSHLVDPMDPICERQEFWRE